MSNVETGRSRAPIIFVFLLILQLLLMSSQSRSSKPGQSLLRSIMLTAVYPVQVAASGVGSFFSGIWYGYIDLRNARQENSDLRAEVERMRNEVLRLQQESSSKKQDEELSRAQKVLPYTSITARVIARDGNSWFNQVVIDKGTIAGLKLHQPVITPSGVVGRIVGIGPVAAQVQLITDGYAGVGGQLVDSRAYGEVKGTGKGVCDMRNVSGLEPVKEGEAIVTSGYDGIYPKGLLIGYVEHLVVGVGAKNHEITVRPAASLDRLEAVLVLQVSEQELNITETVK